MSNMNNTICPACKKEFIVQNNFEYCEKCEEIFCSNDCGKIENVSNIIFDIGDAAGHYWCKKCFNEEVERLNL